MAASFQNMATLTYTGGTVDSNIVTGELREVLTVVKTAVNKSYELGGVRASSAAPKVTGEPVETNVSTGSPAFCFIIRRS